MIATTHTADTMDEVIPAANKYTFAQGIHISFETLLQLRQLATQLSCKELKNKPIYATEVGQKLSTMHGRGLEFAEVRHYQPGDDIRTIDWRVTARTGKTHTKVFSPEKQQETFLIVDYQASMYFGSKKAFKSIIAAQVAALIGWYHLQRGDQVGGWIMGDPFREIAPHQHQRHLLAFLKNLATGSHHAPAPAHPKLLAHTLKRFLHLSMPRSRVFILSDFYELDDQNKALLQQIAQKHSLWLGLIFDPLEENLPPPNHYPITDGQEHGWLETHSVKLRTQFAENFQKRRQQLIDIARKTRSVYFEQSTADPLSTLIK